MRGLGFALPSVATRCCQARIVLVLIEADGGVSWSEWRCESCGKVHGAFADGGSLDLGIIRHEAEEARSNNHQFFFESFEGLI
jgi:hypothetical protein